MTILLTKFYPIPVVIENITASAHITYYAHITPSYPTYPTNTKHLNNIYTTAAQRLRRWSNIV